jgi:hypothetical protein
MSEEKLYAVKNHSGEFCKLFDNSVFRTLDSSDSPITPTTSKDQAEKVANERGGHIVTFVEEPKKVVLTKEQAEVIEVAHDKAYPANYIFASLDSSASGEEELLMEAYVNGYTVAKEKKYLVYKVLGGKQKQKQFAQAYRSSIDLDTISWFIINEVTTNEPTKIFDQFTEAEIERYGLQDCEKKEVADNGIR